MAIPNGNTLLTITQWKKVIKGKDGQAKPENKVLVQILNLKLNSINNNKIKINVVAVLIN